MYMKCESRLTFLSTSDHHIVSDHTKDLSLLSWSRNLSLAKFVDNGITNKHAELCRTIHLPSESRK